jgi:SAM-dependent methyltransferase
MNKLYAELAEVYEAMYATFIDYKVEYELYSAILRKYAQQDLLELGCGTGNLTSYFEQNGFEYLGLDLSAEMLELAKHKNPNSIFIQGDICSFTLEKQVGSMLMAGRTISYIRTNVAINNMMKTVHQNLEKGGIFCFDFIDANRFIPQIAKGIDIVHEAHYKAKDFVRKSKWSLHLQHGMDFFWESNYYKKEGEELIEIGQNDSIIRTFTKDEIIIFLKINGFEIKEILDKTAYAFPTFVVVAEVS